LNQAYYTDSELLEGLAEGDTASIEVFYRLYHPVLMKWMLSRGGMATDADDVFQEALLVIYEKAKSEEFCLTCKLSTYLFAVSKRLWFKKLQQNNQLIFPQDMSESGLDVTDTDMQQYWDKEQKMERLEEALSQLGEPCKSLLSAFYAAQKNMQDIARQFKYTNAENAKTQKYKCLNRLRKIFFKMQAEAHENITN
jgi:RNA polymerase sigma factor (sigma-70 family)